MSSSARVRVLFSFPFALGGPGIGTTAYEQVCGVADQGIEVALFCGSLAAPVPSSVRVVETMAIRGHRIPHRAIGVRNGLRQHDWRVSRALTRLNPEIDLVHCWPSACIRTLRAARSLGIPSLREAPSPHSELAMEDAVAAAASVGVTLPRGHSHSESRRKLEHEFAEFEAADAILVPSDYVSATFAERGFAADRLARHQYGYDPARFSPGSGERPPGAPFTAVFIGRGEPNKGLHLALRAWVDSGVGQHGRFIICGRILPAYERAIGELVAHPSVEVRGWVPNVADVLRDADVLALSSLTEGSALVTFEAQACGCVPLVSEATGAEITHLVEGLVHPTGDVATLAEHFRLLDHDRPLLARLRANAISHSKALTWEHAGERLAAIYRDRARAGGGAGGEPALSG